MSTTNTTNHIGRKISRIRELRGMKQEALAFELGISQQAVSNMERNAEIEANLLIQVAEALGVTPQAIGILVKRLCSTISIISMIIVVLAHIAPVQHLPLTLLTN
jgi:transcriptional regulator with XRE-family HTH domain